MSCAQCGGPLTHNEIGLYKKLMNRAAEEFWCKACLARQLHCSEALLDEKIRQFRRAGCTLFH